MTAAAPPVGTTQVSRIAPTGAGVELTLPATFGAYRWYANTRFTGPRMARQFFLAPAGEHRAIPAHLLAGARERRKSMRGFDAVVFEAQDRSDSALVLVGPYHEATTWFGGPAPDPAGLTTLLSALRFTDSAQGAALTPVSDLLVQQNDVTLVGRSDRSVLMVRRATEMLPMLPEWSGLRMPGGELWRAGRALGERAAARVAGTPHEWRYLLAGDSAAMELVLLGPESGLPVIELSGDGVVDVLATVTGRWAG